MTAADVLFKASFVNIAPEREWNPATPAQSTPIDFPARIEEGLGPIEAFDRVEPLQ